MQDLSFLAAFAIAAANIAGFAFVAADKGRSLNHDERYPEVFFFFIASFFAALGVFVGMFVFRHKTRKIYFPLGIGVLIIQQMLLVWLAMRYFVIT